MLVLKIDTEKAFILTHHVRARGVIRNVIAKLVLAVGKGHKKLGIHVVRRVNALDGGTFIRGGEVSIAKHLPLGVPDELGAAKQTRTAHEKASTS